MNIILEKLEKLKYSPYKQSPEGNIMAINAVLLLLLSGRWDSNVI
jgi:hypothetical protein